MTSQGRSATKLSGGEIGSTQYIDKSVDSEPKNLFDYFSQQHKKLFPDTSKTPKLISQLPPSPD